MRIVLADGVPLFREGLATVLSNRGHQVAVTANCYELIATGKRTRAELVLTDANLPQGAHAAGARASGVRAAIELRRRDPDLNVVVLSCEPDVEAARALLASGASHTAYLLTRRIAGAQTLVDAVHRVAAGATLVDSGVTERLSREADAGPAGPETGVIDPVALLPRRRSEVLALMAQGHSNSRIARELSVSEAAVAGHIAQIYAQLGLVRTIDTNRRVHAVLRFLHHRDHREGAAAGPRG